MSEYKRLGYSIIRNAISKETAQLLSIEFDMVRKVLCLENGFDADYEPHTDEHLPNAFTWYSAYCFDSLSFILQPKLEEVVGCKLYPRYTQSRIYYNGSCLTKHKDKEGNQFGVTICIDTFGNDWDFFLKDYNDEEVRVSLQEGDLCVFDGCNLEHWRNTFSGTKYMQSFLFYVDQDGEYSHLKYDTRPYMGMNTKYKT